MNKSREVKSCVVDRKNISYRPVTATDSGNSEPSHHQTGTQTATTAFYPDHYSVQSYRPGEIGPSCSSPYRYRPSSEPLITQYSRDFLLPANHTIQQSTTRVLTQLNSSGNVLVERSSPSYVTTQSHGTSFTLVHELPIPNDPPSTEEEELFIQNVIRENPIIDTVISQVCVGTDGFVPTEHNFSIPAQISLGESIDFVRQPVVTLQRLDESDMAFPATASVEDKMKRMHGAEDSDHGEVMEDSPAPRTLSPEEQLNILKSVNIKYNQIDWESCRNDDLFLVTEPRLVAMFLFVKNVRDGMDKKNSNRTLFFNIKKDFVGTTYDEIKERFGHCMDTALNDGRTIGEFIHALDPKYNWLVVFLAGHFEQYNGKKTCGEKLKISAEELYVALAQRMNRSPTTNVLSAIVRSTRRIFYDVLGITSVTESASENEEVSI